MNELSVCSNVWFIFFGFTVLLAPCLCVSVHFENKDGGFFIKQSPVRQHYGGPLAPATTAPSSTDATGSGVAAATAGVPLSTDKFVVFQSSQPISVRASYGPFSTKQTVPARYVVPDPLPMNTSGPTIDLHDHSAHHLDISAHIVRSEVPRDSPVLRVLFHAGTDPGGRRQVLLARHHQKVCVVLRASMQGKTPLHAACSPDGEDGVCLAEVTVPSSWWPPLPSPNKEGVVGKLVKTPPRLVQIAYSVLEPWPDEGEGCHPKVQVQPSVVLGSVPLVPARGTYKELRLTDAIALLVPHPPLFPLSKMHLPVYVDRQKAKMLTAIVIRARVKSGVRILEAVPSGSTSWNITVELNPRHTSAIVTLVRKEPPDPDTTDAAEYGTELFTWLIEITEDAIESYDGSKIVWTARFEPHQDDIDIVDSHKTEGRKSTTWFEIQKDDIQAVVPISKNWEVMNTAVLTGLQVSQAMKVFIVSQAGKAADVTFQASCHSEDESVLKVSSSCGSVYVDGSEARGSINGSVIVKYGTYTGIAKFIVWMPEFPLELAVADTRLSQLKSWRVPDYHPSTTKTRKRKKRSYGWGMTAGNDDMGNVIDKPVCRLRYQQTSVDVYAHFFATDHESGRTTYLINRRTSLRITELVLPWLRVSDPRIASLHGRILQGRSMGRTEVQVLSPITSRVYGSKEVRVGNDKVALTKLSVDVVSGLQLNISPDSTVENVYVVETAITRKLTAQYQEGLLDIELEFSDGTKIPLRDISDTDYHLVVESLDPEIVAFAPIVASHHPRVIAVGEGSGDLLQVTLLLADECRSQGKPKGKSASPLATAAAKITVDFSEGELQHRPDILQNDGGSFSGGKGREFVDMEDIAGGSLKDGVHSQIPNVQARQYQGKGVPKKVNLTHSTPLEISMYVLLAAFCCAIAVFVVSCVVYASKFKPMDAGVVAGVRPLAEYPSNITMLHEKPFRKPRDSTTNAHDWVWLGRATVDNSNRNSANLNNNDVRIITNPLNTNYCEPDDSLATCFSNPNHVELPSKTEVKPRGIDSTTYSRSKVDRERDNGSACFRNKPNAPPPLPPHATPLVNSSPAHVLEDDDYRPPIPPHRNIISTSGSNGRTPTPTEPAPVPMRRHHAKSSKEKANSKRFSMEIKSPHSSPPGRPVATMMVDDDVSDDDETAGNMFEFDDELQVDNKKEDKMEFIQYPRSPNANSNRNSGGVKQATVVENRMFNANENASTEKLPSDLGDDLQLDMDYDQIMHYFENLKESNA